jgi:hypothetical protein
VRISPAADAADSERPAQATVNPPIAHAPSSTSSTISADAGTPSNSETVTQRADAGRPSSAACLQYEDHVVLRGIIERASFPGPPGYTSIAKGDARETYWLLRLEQAICVDASPGEFADQAHSNVRRIQLVFLEEDAPYDKYRHLLGHKVEATGTLFGAITGHHHTDVLLTVTDLRTAPRRSK